MEDNELDERTRLEMRKRNQATSPHYTRDSVLRTHRHNLCTMDGQSININSSIDLSYPQNKLRKTRNSQSDSNEPHDYSHHQWTPGAENFSLQERSKRGTTDSSTDTSDDEKKERHLVIQHDTAPIKASRILLNRPNLSQRAQQNETSVSEVVRHREKLLNEIFSLSVNHVANIQDKTRVTTSVPSTSRSIPNNFQHFRESPLEVSHTKVKSTGENHSDQIVPTRSSIKNNQPTRRDLSNETIQPSQISIPSRHVPDFNIKFQLNLPIPEIIITNNTDMEGIAQMGFSANTMENTPPLVQNTVNILNQQCQSTNRSVKQQPRQIAIGKEDFNLHHNNYGNARSIPSITQHSVIDLTSRSSAPNNNSIPTVSSIYRQQDKHTQTLSAEETPPLFFNNRPRFQELPQNLSHTGENIRRQSESVDLSVKSSMKSPRNSVDYGRYAFSQGVQMNADTLSLPTARYSHISERYDCRTMAPGYTCIRKGPHPQASYANRLMDMNRPDESTIGIQSGNQHCHICKSLNGQLAAPIKENIRERPADKSCCCNCQCLRERQASSHVDNHADQHGCFENTVIRKPLDNNSIIQSFSSKTNTPHRSSANLYSLDEEKARSLRPAEKSSEANNYGENTHLTRKQFTSTADLNSSNTNFRFPIASEIMKMYNRSYGATSIEDSDKINRNKQTTRLIMKTNNMHREETKKLNHDENHANNRHNAYLKYNPYILLPPEYEPNNTRWTLKHQHVEPGLVELLPSSNVFVDAIRLRYYKLKAKSYNKLARMLLTEIFTPDALNVCSLIDPVKVLKIEVAREKPCLDIHAIIVLLKFLQNYGHTKHWGVFDRQYTLESLRYKLKELKRKIY